MDKAEWGRIINGEPMSEEALETVLEALKAMPPLDFPSAEAHGHPGGTAIAVSLRVRNLNTYNALRQLNALGRVKRLLTYTDTVYYI